MRLSATAALAALALVACSAKGVTSPPDPPKVTFTVVIDAAFTPDQQTEIAAGADAWSIAVGPDLTFAYLVTPRALIDAAFTRAPKPDTIYVVRVSTATEIPNCLLLAAPFACYDGTSRIWLAADDIDALSVWRIIPQHEFGHAFGLAHANVSSVMQPEVIQMAYSPTAADVAAYCQYHGCPNYSPYRPKK
jgi:hypothetical protein